MRGRDSMLKVRVTSLVKSVAIAASLAILGTGVSATAAHADPITINLYEAIGYAPAEIAAFNASQSMYKVVDVGGSTGPLLAKVAAEGSNPQWGLFWADGDEWAAAADLNHQLATVAFKPSYDHIGKQLAPKNNSYVVTGATVMVAGLYNSSVMSNPPKSFQGLLSPAVKGKIGMNDPNISGPTYPFIAGVMSDLGSEDAGKTFFQSLKANGLVVNDKNGPTIHALEVGQIQMGLVQSSAAVAELIKFNANPVAGYKPAIVYPGRPTLMPSSLAIDKNRPAAEVAGAQAFVKFVLSPAGQAILGTTDATQNSDVICWPTINGTVANKYTPALPSAYQIVDPYKWGPLQSEIDAWFTSSIRSK